MRLFLFDVDATLILTGGAGLRALNRAFRRLFNLQNAMNGIAPHGKTDPAIVREIFRSQLGENVTEVQMASVLESYVEFLRDEIDHSDSYQILPGISNILDELSHRNDVLLGLATGNIETGARIKLRRGDLNRYFEFGGYGSDSEDRVGLVRRAVEKSTTFNGGTMEAKSVFVIGDTPLDIAAGRDAGCWTIGVATGQFSVEQLRDAGADLAIANFHEDRDQFLRTTFML